MLLEMTVLGESSKLLQDSNRKDNVSEIIHQNSPRQTLVTHAKLKYSTSTTFVDQLFLVYCLQTAIHI